MAFVREALAEIERGERIMLSIVDDKDHAMGSVDFRFTNNRCEIGFVIGPKHRNKGIVKAALRGALAFLEQQLPKMLFFAYVDRENIPSQLVLEGCGFKRDSGHDKKETREKLRPPARTMWYYERPKPS